MKHSNKIAKEDILISIDVETTGISPATSSCVMIGCTVFKNVDVTSETDLNEWIIDVKRWTLKEIENRPMEKHCEVDFWSKNKDLWQYIQEHAIDAKIAMESFATWYDDLLSKYNCTFIARPSSFDWQWINCVYDEFGPENKPKLPHSITCVSTIIRVVQSLGVDYDKHLKPLFHHPKLGMTHYADDDATYQAYMYLRLINWMKTNMLIK